MVTGLNKKILSSILCVILLLIPINEFCLAYNNMYPNVISGATLDISLNFTQTNGIIKPFSEINSGPLSNPNTRNGADLIDQYQQIGISYVRASCFIGPADINTIFPDWNADPNLESSYDFIISDKYITGIIEAGCKVFYRLGDSIYPDKNLLMTPPKNMSKWAEVCKHIAMHYNDGWNEGYHYNITYWEVWNEPNLFWEDTGTGTADEYYQLYNSTVRALKGHNSSLKVGGPAIYTITTRADKNWTEGFLDYLDNNDLPLDFFSWHHYPYDPYEIYADSQVLLGLLNKYGFTDCENIISEWDYKPGVPQRDKDNAKNAAFDACCMTMFQDVGVDYAYRFRGTPGGEPHWFLCLTGHDHSLFSKDGKFKTPALSYLAMHYVTRDTPIRLTTPVMDAFSGITYLAGISEDNTNVSILISNYNASDTSYNLEVTDLPWNAPYTVVHYLIDDKHHLEIYKEENASGSSYYATQILKKNTVHFIRLTNTSFIPNEGPPTARIPLILRLKIFDPFLLALDLVANMLLFGNFGNTINNLIKILYNLFNF